MMVSAESETSPDPETDKPVKDKPVNNKPVKEPFLDNPLKLAPTGSGSWHLARADIARSFVILTSIYGFFEAIGPSIVQALSVLGPEGQLIIRHGDLIATAFAATMAAIAAISHVVIAFARDNQSKTDTNSTKPS
jgi:hypothetical protein